MQTRTCKQCLEDKPIKDFPPCGSKQKGVYRRMVCRTCRLEAEKIRRDSKDEVEKPPRVTLLPHFETSPQSNDLWPANRLFFREEFMDSLNDGVWPPGLRVSDEKGGRFEVCLQLKRIKG